MGLSTQEARVDLLKDLNFGLPSLDGRRVSKPGYALTEIRPPHREIIRLAVAGLKHVEIAEKISCHKQTVSNVLNNPIVMRQIAMLQKAKDVEATEATSLDDLRPEAVSALEELVTDGDEKAKQVRLGAAKEILDRTDGKAIQRHDVTQTSILVQQIEILKSRARDAGVLPEGDVEDVQDAEVVEESSKDESTPEAVNQEGSDS